jgi:hypothetical protein
MIGLPRAATTRITVCQPTPNTLAIQDTAASRQPI